ncbi:transketolase C-terminal domain-containing protein [Streptomyces sp. LHD-70]|uniref:transketolase-like TK C-terminal-containing protein n=1 Tax=Streptomyces sp. LHD-70 TaxID=3072140 RepID=UPI00280ED179|nr:transketolase C-terminal domain-containing protein [Streptomyces sp. LHD-70]MDQ8707222.1 transketolase C-terminal domain-containing protein [Streptomyces sp. LHD-70]
MNTQVTLLRRREEQLVPDDETERGGYVLDESERGGHAPDESERGGYILAEADGGRPDVVLVATGDEVHVALTAREILQREGTPTRVVSMPDAAWFRAQPAEYRDTVLPPGVRARVSVESGTALGSYAMLGAAPESVGLAPVGAGAAYESLRRHAGLTPERVAAAARGSLQRAAAAPCSGVSNPP